jgi:hypothetical protein
MTQERVDLTKAFSLTFSFNAGDKDANGADGLAFVIHNDPLGNQALGGNGGAMGALNIQNGLAIQLDTYQNQDDPNDIPNDHTSFIDTDSHALVSPVVDLGNIEDGEWHTVTIYWTGQSLSYTVDGVHIATLTEDIAATYLGGSQFAYLASPPAPAASACSPRPHREARCYGRGWNALAHHGTQRDPDHHG